MDDWMKKQEEDKRAIYKYAFTAEFVDEEFKTMYGISQTEYESLTSQGKTERWRQTNAIGAANNPFAVDFHAVVKEGPVPRVTLKDIKDILEDSNENSDDDLDMKINRVMEDSVFQNQTMEQAQKERLEKEERQKWLQKMEDQRLEAEQLRELEQQREERHLQRERQNFVDQKVLETSTKFKLLSEEQRNALGKIRRNAYDKKKEEWNKNVEQQRAVANKMAELKELADNLYQRLDFEWRHPVDERQYVESFAAENNTDLLMGNTEQFCNDVKFLFDQNKQFMKMLEEINQRYSRLEEELQELKRKQGFPVAKKKAAQPHDCLGNLFEVNSFLRTGSTRGEPLSPELLRGADAAENRINKPLGKQVVVHKSISLKEWAEMTGHNLQEDTLRSGRRYQSFRDRGFCKASLSEEEMSDVELIIAVDKTVLATHVSGVNRGEKDSILLPPGTRYHILKEEKYYPNENQLHTQIEKQKLRVYLTAL